MNLVLSVTDAEGAALGPNPARTFDQSGGIVGRSSTVDWSLPDERRRVSSQHFRISYRDGNFILTDLSVNGTYLNDADSPIGKGQSVKLRDGDVLTVGHYTIEAALVDGEGSSDAAHENPFVDEPVTPMTGLPDFGGADPFGQANEFPGKEAEGLDPLELLQGGPPKAKAQGLPGADSDHTPIIEDFLNIPAPTAGIPDDFDPLSQSALHEPTELAPPRARKPVAPLTSGADDATPVASIPASAGSDDLFAAFLRGAGASPDVFGGMSAEESMEIVGRLFRNTLFDLRDLLMARNKTKSGFRLEVTMIQPQENNPLKFTAGDVDELMRGLFNQRGGGYLGAEEAFEDAFNDIKTHQIGLIAGMRAAFSGLLRRLDPASIEAEATRDGGRLGLFKKSSKWEAYVALYDELDKAAQDDTQLLFGQDFARAYMQQMRDR